MDFDLIIRQGRIVDGTGVASFVGDLAIENGKVARIDGLRAANGRRELDADGLIVAPGFIDLHTHYDAQIFWDPYCTISGWHGVTSVVLGNCGFGFAPVRPEDRDRSMLAMTRNEAIDFTAMKLGMPWDWVTFPEFLDSVERTPKGVNCSCFAPLAPIIVWVMGLEAAKKRQPTRGEIEDMKRLLHVAMDAGACGFSLQKLGEDSVQPDYDGTPMVTDIMSDELILEFASVLRERGEGFVQITYAPFNSKMSLAEVFASDHTRSFVEELARASGRPILHNVVMALALMPDLHRGSLAWLKDANSRGLRIFGQGDHVRNWYQLTYEDFNLWDSAPAWKEAFLGSDEEKIAHLHDPALRRRMLEQESLLMSGAMGASIPKFTLTSTGGNDALVGYVDRSMGEIGETEGRNPIDVMLDIARDSKLKAEFKSTLVKEPKAELTAELLKSPYVVPGISDGGAHSKFFIGGAYPTDMLRWMVREEKLLTLEEAHQKLSYLPAQAAGLRDRGLIREGSPADLVVYDLDALRPDPDWSYDQAYDLPGGDWRRIQRAVGYRWTIVNGEITLVDGEPTGTTPGRLLRGGRG